MALAQKVEVGTATEFKVNAEPCEKPIPQPNSVPTVIDAKVAETTETKPTAVRRYLIDHNAFGRVGSLIAACANDALPRLNGFKWVTNRPRRG